MGGEKRYIFMIRFVRLGLTTNMQHIENMKRFFGNIVFKSGKRLDSGFKVFSVQDSKSLEACYTDECAKENSALVRAAIAYGKAKGKNFRSMNCRSR